MKFLHLSDLHIGKSVNGVSMLEEQRHVLGQVMECVRAERPDAVVIAGDVYDRAVPGTEAIRLFDDVLTDLSRENTAILLVPGNHDAAERLTFAGRLLEDKRLYLCGSVEGGMRRVTLDDAFGKVHFWLLPFIKPASVRGYFGAGEIDDYNEAVEAVIGVSGVDFKERNVLVSHQFYTKAGWASERSESELDAVGGLDAVDAGLIEHFDYAALGHLHGAQRVGAEYVRYAGSPLKYSFSEARQSKSMTLVEMGEKGSVTIRTRPLTPIHDMRVIKGPLAALLEAGAADADREDYLRVTLTDEDEPIDPLGKLRSVYPNVMMLDFDNARSAINIADIAPGAASHTRLSPYELFAEFFLEVNGAVMSAEQGAMLRDVLDTSGWMDGEGMP